MDHRLNNLYQNLLINHHLLNNHHHLHLLIQMKKKKIALKSQDQYAKTLKRVIIKL